ncbi:MAG: hypothetical protein IPK29_09120 [Betaproteobacteria bacterium]|nr:hypothetical protein [Betaproteobacteria bacterium]
MAISWLTVLKSVPWTEVISNAPKVAEGAKKLWNTVGRKRAAREARAQEAQADLSPEARMLAAEATIAELQAQMLASSELINTLAEQNALLVARVEANRRRVAWLALVAGVALVIAVVAMTWR